MLVTVSEDPFCCLETVHVVHLAVHEDDFEADLVLLPQLLDDVDGLFTTHGAVNLLCQHVLARATVLVDVAQAKDYNACLDVEVLVVYDQDFRVRRLVPLAEVSDAFAAADIWKLLFRSNGL